MPQENVETVRRIYEGWATGDITAGFENLDEHVVFIATPDLPAFGVFYGRDAVAQFVIEFLEQWDQFTAEAKEIEAAGDTVLVHAVMRGKGRASGIEGEVSHFMLITFRGRKIVRMESVTDEAEALEAVGLSEDTHP